MKTSLLFFSFFILSLIDLKAQYLEFGDILKILEFSENRAEAEEFLIQRGFEFFNLQYIQDEEEEDEEAEEDTSNYLVDYVKYMNGDEYFIRVSGDYEEDIFAVSEQSYNEDRWHYFVGLMSDADLEPVDYKSGGNLIESFEFEANDNFITLSKYREDGKMRFTFYISRY